MGVTSTVVLVVAAAAIIPIWLRRGTAPVREQQPVKERPYWVDSVPTNRGKDVVDGFRGDVHRLLHGKTSLAVAAHWTPVGQGRDQLEKRVPPHIYRLFTDLRVASPNRVYTETAFSAFMPVSVQSVGQVWEIGLDGVAEFLRQFHPRPSVHLVALGRRAGPDGAFAVLRAVSATHLDIVFRIHAEFDIAQNMWYTPSCFWGRMIVDKQAGKVESFRLWLPTDLPLNVHLTVAVSQPKGEAVPVVFREIQPGDRLFTRRDIVRVEQMELVSANPGNPDLRDWSDSIDMESAQRQLKEAFYGFAAINWVPWERALAAASTQHKPILAVVLWGALDDQSC
jgi:hypothetical protein